LKPGIQLTKPALTAIIKLPRLSKKEQMVLSDRDLMMVQDKLQEISAPVTMLIAGTGEETPFETNLLTVARQIAGVSPNAIIFDDSGEKVFPGKPVITLSSAGSGNIHYVAVPEGPELAPFLDAIRWLGSGQGLPESKSLELLDGKTDPSNILVLIAGACPNCPDVVRRALTVAARQPLIRVTILDVIQNEDIGKRFKVKSTPTVIIDDAATHVGTLTLEKLISYLLHSGVDEELSGILESMINAGRAQDAADLLCRKKQPQALLPLYATPDFTARMGALLVFDESLEKDPRIFDPIVGQLIDLLSHENAGLRGDTAELLGRIGASETIPALRKAIEDPDPDVCEAAREALQLLEGR
jgi:hypothetical protein